MKRLFLITLVLGVFITSCQNDSKSLSDYDMTETGLYYRFYNCNEGITPQFMELMDVQLSCCVNDTSVILPLNRTILQLTDPLFAGDIFEGLGMMHKGDSASFIVRIDSTYYTLFRRQTMPAEFTVDDIMRFDVKMNDFYPESEFAVKQIEFMKNTFIDETVKAESELNQYFKDNNINATSTPSGLYYVTTQSGNGEKPQVGASIKVHYTGKLLDGTVFDSSVSRNEPFQFDLGLGQVIPGWDEGFQLMSKGEKATLYIPYYLAYGSGGYGVIPPFETLIFDVELIDF